MPLRAAIVALTLVACFCPSVSGQIRENDPRYVEDPRDIKDPREVVDPRDAETQPVFGGEDEAPSGPDHFDDLYAAGNLGELTQAMREAPWELLDYIDDHCDRWLKLVEAGRSKSKPRTVETDALKEKTRDVARLADAGIGDSRFGYYVETVFRWDQEQQQVFRQGRQLFREGAAIFEQADTAVETLAALTPLRQALAHAREVDDILGQSKSISMIGRIQSVNSRPTEARDSMREAVRVGREIRDLDAVWDGLSVIMETSLRQQDFDSALRALQEQHQLSVEVGDEESAQQVLRQLVQLDSYMRANNR
jgi:hypothetical protein